MAAQLALRGAKLVYRRPTLTLSEGERPSGVDGEEDKEEIVDEVGWRISWTFGEAARSFKISPPDALNEAIEAICNSHLSLLPLAPLQPILHAHGQYANCPCLASPAYYDGEESTPSQLPFRVPSPSAPDTTLPPTAVLCAFFAHSHFLP